MNNRKDTRIHIRAGTFQDIEKLEKLYDDVNGYYESGINYPGWIKGVYPVRETAEAGLLEKNLFILTVDDDIAGSVILNNKIEEAYNEAVWNINAGKNEVIAVHTLVVAPKYMGQGIGKKLMEYAKAYARQQKAKTIRLDVSVRNTPAISLYEKCGYTYITTVDLGLPYEHLKWFKLYELVL